MYIRKSIECECGNHEACCHEYTQNDEFDGWRCDCSCHSKNKKHKKSQATCHNCGSSHLDLHEEEYIDVNLVNIIYNCVDCAAKVSVLIASEAVDDVVPCGCGLLDETNYTMDDIFCPVCGGSWSDGRK